MWHSMSKHATLHLEAKSQFTTLVFYFLFFLHCILIRLLIFFLNTNDKWKHFYSATHQNDFFLNADEIKKIKNKPPPSQTKKYKLKHISYSLLFFVKGGIHIFTPANIIISFGTLVLSFFFFLLDESTKRTTNRMCLISS